MITILSLQKHNVRKVDLVLFNFFYLLYFTFFDYFYS